LRGSSAPPEKRGAHQATGIGGEGSLTPWVSAAVLSSGFDFLLKWGQKTIPERCLFKNTALGSFS